MTNLLWLDLETTGLDPERDLILEIGLVLSEGLDRILDSASIVIDHGAIHMPPEVLDLHLDNGLLQDIGKRGVTPSEAYVQVMRYLNDWFPHRHTDIVVGGSGIDRFDIPFLKAADYPLNTIPSYFHYGTLDTSGLKRIAKLAGYNNIAGRGGATHRAIEDATDSFHLAQRFSTLLERYTGGFPKALEDLS
jgi:oligoribonuclease